MALKSTVFKATLNVTNLDRHYYAAHSLTLARHPSETDERMMMRLLAFALHAHADLAFGRGLSTEDEPDLWRRDLTGAIELWADLGQPDEKRIRRACGRAAQVFIYSYGSQGADSWWNQIGAGLNRLRNLTVARIPSAHSRAMAGLARRGMQLNYTMQDGQVWVADGDHTAQVEIEWLRAAQPPAR